MAEATQHEQLREEFNRWAEAGRGEGMEQDHLPIVLPVLDRMQLQPDDNVLDVGCGAGWLSSLLAEHVPEGRVVGIDVSDEMIRHARRRNVNLENVMSLSARPSKSPGTPPFSPAPFPSSPPTTGPIRRARCKKSFASCAKAARPGSP